MFKPLGDWNGPLVPMAFSFLQPARLRVTLPNGTRAVMGYGIGDAIEIMMPATVKLACGYEPWHDIVLADGTVVEEIPDGTQLTRGRTK